MQGMQSKESGDKGALPESSRHPVKEPEQKKRTQDVQNQIRDMVSSGMKTIKLIIGHQGQPDKRVPQTEIFGAKGPEEAFFGQTGLDIAVFCNVSRIVIINKVVSAYLSVNGERKRCQDYKNNNLLFAIANEHHELYCRFVGW